MGRHAPQIRDLHPRHALDDERILYQLTSKLRGEKSIVQLSSWNRTCECATNYARPNTADDTRYCTCTYQVPRGLAAGWSLSVHNRTYIEPYYTLDKYGSRVYIFITGRKQGPAIYIVLGPNPSRDYGEDECSRHPRFLTAFLSRRLLRV